MSDVDHCCHSTQRIIQTSGRMANLTAVSLATSRTVVVVLEPVVNACLTSQQRFAARSKYRVLQTTYDMLQRSNCRFSVYAQAQYKSTGASVSSALLFSAEEIWPTCDQTSTIWPIVDRIYSAFSKPTPLTVTCCRCAAVSWVRVDINDSGSVNGVVRIKKQAKLKLTNMRDSFWSQSRSSNIQHRYSFLLWNGNFVVNTRRFQIFDCKNVMTLKSTP